jgi:peptide/nickel transport system permease protein
VTAVELSKGPPQEPPRLADPPPPPRRLLRRLLRPVVLFVVNLVLLSALVFVGAEVLPGNIGRLLLGRTADQRSVDVLNHELGADRPLVVRYLSFVNGLLHGDLGTSLALRQPNSELLGAALLNSLKLAALAFVIVVPLALLGGVLAALRRDTWVDRTIIGVGVALTVLPEFVTGLILILVLSLGLKLFPVTATAPPGSGALTQLYYLVLPALPLVIVLFGYLAKLARAGTITALDSEYHRTAVLKGLPARVVVTRHVLRNALLPTISVLGTQAGYLIGGLVVVEILFNYRGIGSLIFMAAQNKDIPLLEVGVLTVGVAYMLLSALSDLIAGLLDPRVRAR